MFYRTKITAVFLCIAGLFTGPVTAQSQDTSYLVLLNQNGKISKNFGKDVAHAGGTVKVMIDEIGVAFVSSGEPDFKSNLARARGVQEVAYSLPAFRRDDITTYQAQDVDSADVGVNEFWYPLQWGIDAVKAPQAWAGGRHGFWRASGCA